MDALSAPLFRSLLVGVLATASIAAVTSSGDDSVTRRLSLHSIEERNSYYLSAWEDGDVHVTFPDSELHGVVFYSRARLTDGCRWTGIEKLTPISGNAFFYEYSESITECKAGAKPYRKTPRTGMVTIESEP
jgi:hypothetical protein